MGSQGQLRDQKLVDGSGSKRHKPMALLNLHFVHLTITVESALGTALCNCYAIVMQLHTTNTKQRLGAEFAKKQMA